MENLQSIRPVIEQIAARVSAANRSEIVALQTRVAALEAAVAALEAAVAALTPP